MKKKYIEQVLSLLQIQAKISNRSFRNSQEHSNDCVLPLYEMQWLLLLYCVFLQVLQIQKIRVGQCRLIV